MKNMIALSALSLAGAIFLVAFVRGNVRSAAWRLANPALSETPRSQVADDAEASYCTPEFKKVLQRVLHACGLAGSNDRRGCQPADVKSFANIDDEDFNALFDPLVHRGAIIMFDDASDKLDDSAKKLIEDKWDERHGARYFFIVARASKTGTADLNRALSHKRANSVKFHIQTTFSETVADLEKQVGTLWLGAEFAQLKKEYCSTWTISQTKKCTEEAINRSAFISWVDCRL